MPTNTWLALAVAIVGGLFMGFTAQRGGFKALFDFSSEWEKRYAGGVKADILIATIISLICFIVAFCINKYVKNTTAIGVEIFLCIGFYLTGRLIANEQKHYEP